MKTIIFTLLLVALVHAAAAEPPGTLLQHLEREVELDAGKLEEPCFAMLLGDRLEFVFNSGEPLDFNLHYHQEDAIFFPVEKKNVRAHQGEYIASGSRQYCLMWTNRGDATATLNYRYQLYRMGTPQ
jgi:hypothetical protein